MDRNTMNEHRWSLYSTHTCTRGLGMWQYFHSSVQTLFLKTQPLSHVLKYPPLICCLFLIIYWSVGMPLSRLVCLSIPDMSEDLLQFKTWAPPPAAYGIMATAAFSIGGAPGPQIIDQTSLLEPPAQIDAKSSTGKRQHFVLMLEN